MTRILLLGAGRSASSLLQYLLQHAPQQNWQLTVADMQPAHLEPVLAAHAAYAQAVPFGMQNETGLLRLVQGADIVVSMLPALLHGPWLGPACNWAATW
ncbi:saccharopine dehydrogenase NADP-binding domain-containing protein [Hymenobacter sp. 5516J-16]|uniref:saccharopine dehydrogenase NADP-binding domain-containing protein n=1 Tax=Hymenobacter sp. 5516J-16 TaxID=2932253 RepID=UPI001FD2C34E|nr:saccharopine dehydrogenase NADP-binding domain-containing protein [Hymenobacter sp. 5516J-16]UOQ77006.1 saccharopine dehydrogenase NADP-binding domain-containing protein [Hymenobacter sp. 5516J-16]